jgi:hypothetical protein
VFSRYELRVVTFLDCDVAAKVGELLSFLGGEV